LNSVLNKKSRLRGRDFYESYMMEEAAHEIPFLSDRIKIIIGICTNSRHVFIKNDYLITKLQKIFKIQKKLHHFAKTQYPQQPQ
jgi:hypothetical protein